MRYYTNQFLNVCLLSLINSQEKPTDTQMILKDRQHNGEISGGAKYTTAHKGANGWHPVAIINGFPNNKWAMSFEWRMKKYKNSKGKLKSSSGLNMRLKNIFEIIQENKITSKSLPPSEIPLITICVNKKYQSFGRKIC